MKWTASNWIALASVLLNIIQALNIFIKNRYSHSEALKSVEHQRQIESDRREESNRQHELAMKQLELRHSIDEKALQNSLDKIKLANIQSNYEKILPRTQEIFEKYIYKTSKLIQEAGTVPVNFDSEYKELESIVILYCPQISNKLEEINSYNVPYEDANEQQQRSNTKEKWNRENFYLIKESWIDIITTLNEQMLQQSQLSKQR